jgi:hypothetical protein
VGADRSADCPWRRRVLAPGSGVCSLLVLPLLHLLEFNDLVMRGGIPAMTVLFCATLAVPGGGLQRALRTGTAFCKFLGFALRADDFLSLSADFRPTHFGHTDSGSVNKFTTIPVPGSLPFFGAGAVFGFSRKLRQRLKASRLSCSIPPHMDRSC